MGPPQRHVHIVGGQLKEHANRVLQRKSFNEDPDEVFVGENLNIANMNSADFALAWLIDCKFKMA